ncbi:MAG TPA: NAD(P)-binding domain-containing protein [Pseudonocardiaceae bacterium]|nr:NAD(P)-binding domain-containing protein [Pseudonocardiaceae bacterium]
MRSEVLDYLVVGAGPAGIQLAHDLDRAGRDYLVVEAGAAPGMFFGTYPRHRTLISINKVHTGYDDPELRMRMDWNSLLSDNEDLLFTRYSKKFLPPAESLLRYLADFVEATGIKVRFNTRVSRISRPGDFRVELESGEEITARRVIVATGVGLPNIPDIPGIEHAEQYADVSVDPDEFTDQKVLVIGKGNSAFETADNLLETAAVIHVAGPSPLKLAWRTHFVGHLRAANNNLLDTYQLKLQNALLDGHVRNIERDPDGGYRVTFGFVRAEEILKDIHYDRIIVCTGFRFDPTIFADDLTPELVINDRFPAQSSAWESVNIPDLYFAGTLSQMRDFKKSSSAFIHGFRYCARALRHVLDARYEGVPWPSREISAKPAEVMEALIERVNRSSALFQQFGFLGDLVVVDEQAGTARYYEQVPVDYIADGGFGSLNSYFVATLDYGPDHDKYDPFDSTARQRISQSETERADEGHYLHPVVRHYRNGELVGTHHVTENLENEWTNPAVHREPLAAFIAKQS